ncbi:MAG TPA: hypothetical protein VN791_05480 [Acidimicrobiales bacterium]|nr:hypothetical protein [Acidimicrobiales bacterium]
MNRARTEGIRITARTIRIGLGTVWLFDGVLQLQPRMFGPAFASQVIRPNAGGQAGLVAWSIDEMARLVSVHPAASNWIFAAVQILIGVGLLRPATARPALVLSFFWAAGVWTFGEGIGMLLTGTASPLSGAPGAVLLYALIGVVAWPRRSAGVAPGGRDSAAAAGPLGDGGTRVAWAVLWLGMASLWLLPANDGPDAVSGALRAAAGSSPIWLAHVQIWMAGILRGDGTAVAVALAVLSAAIGVGPLSRRPTVFLILGAALSVDFWILGQSFGGIVTGLATDPNTGPLFVLLALALFRNEIAPSASRAGGPAPATVPLTGGDDRTLVPA